jgi:Uma2 family endonuclease
MAQAPFTAYRWNRAEYERLLEQRALEDDPLELIDGQLVVAEPKAPCHSAAVLAVGDAVRAELPRGWIVRVQDALALDDASEPEPDLAIVSGAHADYRHAHPSRAALVIEVADASLRFDRHQKGSAYARAGVEDYWIVNLVGRVVEVYRKPVADPSAPYDWCYASLQTFTPSEMITPLALPSARIAVAPFLASRPGADRSQL